MSSKPLQQGVLRRYNQCDVVSNINLVDFVRLKTDTAWVRHGIRRHEGSYVQ